MNMKKQIEWQAEDISIAEQVGVHLHSIEMMKAILATLRTMEAANTELPPEPQAIQKFRAVLNTSDFPTLSGEWIPYIDALRTAAVALARDAGRYQWLREQDTVPYPSDLNPGELQKVIVFWDGPQELDAAIDTAMRKGA